MVHEGKMFSTISRRSSSSAQLAQPLARLLHHIPKITPISEMDIKANDPELKIKEDMQCV